MIYPTGAIVAVTLNCNARCVMCDIWRNRQDGEMRPEEYRRIPASLKDVNITGGEPFLRDDLPEVIRVIKESCPGSRLVISTNGFLPERIKAFLPELLKTNSDTALRISIDGLEKTHDLVRGIPGGFQKAMDCLEISRTMGVKDLGIAMTVMEANIKELPMVYRLANSMGVEFSVTVATDSQIYFGEGKETLRPKDTDLLTDAMLTVIRSEYTSWQPKRWFRGWFSKTLLEYLQNGRRPIPCDAGRGFFYLDSEANVFACHILSTPLGNIRKQPWQELWRSAQAEKVRKDMKACEECWMVCTSKSEIRKRLVKVGAEVFSGKICAHAGLI